MIQRQPYFICFLMRIGALTSGVNKKSNRLVIKLLTQFQTKNGIFVKLYHMCCLKINTTSI